LNLYKQEIKIAADESNHRKALLEVAESSVYKLNHENQDLRSEIDKLRQRITMLR